MMTNDEERSSTMAVDWGVSAFLRFLLAKSRLAILTGGNSPLFLFSLNLSWYSCDKLVGRILQLEGHRVSLTMHKIL